jgi:ribosomal protein L37AE/L43A
MTIQQLTPKQFRAAFRTEKQCRDYLLTIKHPGGFSCRKCKHQAHHEIAHRAAWQCANCGYQESAKAGTIFHKSHVTLVNWFQAIFELTISKGGISAVELRERLGLGSYKTAWGMLHKLRKAMAHRDASRPELSGVVELDGAFISRRKRGNQSAVYLAVEVKKTAAGKPCAGRLAAAQVVKLRRDEAVGFVLDNVAERTKVRTDGGLELASLDVHTNVELESRKNEAYPVLSDNWLPWVHRIITNLKAALVGVYHGVSSKYLSAYLAEYCYRFNRRQRRDRLQLRLLHACAAAPHHSLADIKG